MSTTPPSAPRGAGAADPEARELLAALSDVLHYLGQVRPTCWSGGGGLECM